eukprot:4323996-Alexandrium_andersonii.AAC.1
MGRDPTLLPGAQSKSGSVAPWNWRSFFDQPPPHAEGAQSLEKDNEERNRIMDEYAGSGYDAAQEFIDLLEPQTYRQARVRREVPAVNRAAQLRAQARTIEEGSKANRVKLKARNLRAPHGPGEAASPPQGVE